MSKIRDELDLKLLLRHKSIPGQVCGSCRKTVIHSENCPVVLKAELAAAHQRLEAAEDWIIRLGDIVKDLAAYRGEDIYGYMLEVIQDSKAFLTSTTPPQATEPEPTACTDDTPGSCVKTAHLVDATEPEFVQVRMGDLKLMIGFYERRLSVSCNFIDERDAYDRLKATLAALASQKETK